MKRFLLLVVFLLLPASALAHGVRSAYLEIDAQDETHALVTLRSPVPSAELEIAPPRDCTLANTAEGAFTLECPKGIRGTTIEVRGMGPILSETSAVATFSDGTTASQLLSPSAPAWTLPREENGFGAFRRYIGLGMVHIATGFDHLLFLLGLVLVVRRLRAVLVAETAFTLSHTISLGATALGFIRVSASAAEACIAASLVLIALDIGRPTAVLGRKASAAAAIAFVFGAIHGLGFAGGLREIGLPEKAIVPALAGFATGIEIGQVLFIVLVLVLLHVLGIVLGSSQRPRIDRAAAYAIGVTGAFWLFQRLSTFL